MGGTINNGIKSFSRRPEAASEVLRKWITAVFKVLRCKMHSYIGGNFSIKRENLNPGFILFAK
jgi:hypothetical protein